jgi:hypothetical protein
MTKTVKAGLATIAIGLLGCGVLCEQAQATFITGSIQFMGPATPSGSSPGTPITIHFTNPGWHTFLNPTGVYSTLGVPSNMAATFSDFSFTGDGLTAALSAGVSPLWTFDLGGKTFSFDLKSLTNGSTTPGSMSFTGSGTSHITGFEDTPGTIAFQGAGEDFSFQFSSSTTTSRGAVPEGGTSMVLLAIGLAGIVMLHRQLRPA